MRFLFAGGAEYLAHYSSIELVVHWLIRVRRDIR